MLAEIGVVLLLFSVGLETRLDEMKRVGRSALLVGVLGVIIPFVLGSLWAHGSGFDWAKSLFVAAAFVATSAGITARVLQELGVLQREESRVILGAAVIDDILAMLLLGVVTALQSGESLQSGGILPSCWAKRSVSSSSSPCSARTSCGGSRTGSKRRSIRCRR